MAEFNIRAFQGQGETWTITLSASAFFGTEPLSATVGRGDGTDALLTLIPQWNTGDAQTSPATLVDLPISASQTAGLTPGPYAVLVSLASAAAPLAAGLLEVYPAPGGAMPPFYRALANPALAQSLVPELNQDQIDTLPLMLIAATRCCETYCGRSLFLDSFDHIIRPRSGTCKVRLRSRPVVEVSRVATDVVSGCTVRNDGTGLLSGATVREVTAAPGSLQLAALEFRAVAAGVPIVQLLTLSAYPTFADLAAAINGLGNGWVARTQPPLAGLPVADAFGSPGTRNALNQDLWIHTHDMPLGAWWTDAEKGWLEINEPIPGGFLVPNPRVERTDTRYWGIRCTYRAGYAYFEQDLALGYEPVPEDLAVAVVMTANAAIENIPMVGPLHSQRVADRSYTLQKDISLIPQSAESILARFIDPVF